MSFEYTHIDDSVTRYVFLNLFIDYCRGVNVIQNGGVEGTQAATGAPAVEESTAEVSTAEVSTAAEPAAAAPAPAAAGVGAVAQAAEPLPADFEKALTSLLIVEASTNKQNLDIFYNTHLYDKNKIVRYVMYKLNNNITYDDKIEQDINTYNNYIYLITSSFKQITSSKNIPAFEARINNKVVYEYTTEKKFKIKDDDNEYSIQKVIFREDIILPECPNESDFIRRIREAKQTATKMRKIRRKIEAEYNKYNKMDIDVSKIARYTPIFEKNMNAFIGIINLPTA